MAHYDVMKKVFEQFFANADFESDSTLPFWTTDKNLDRNPDCEICMEMPQPKTTLGPLTDALLNFSGSFQFLSEYAI